MFIDLDRSTLVTDLVASYKRIRGARKSLLEKWRFALLRAYAKRRERYERERASQRVRQERLERSRWWALLTLPALCMAGYFLALTTQFCAGMLLMIGAGAGILLAWKAWKAAADIPHPPRHPLAQSSRDKFISPLKNTLFPDNLPGKWRRELRDPIPSELAVQRLTDDEGQYGLIGEYNLVRALAKVVTANTVILHSVMPKAKDDLDVVVIGPKGIWYFEVKYINAHIQWRDNRWTLGKLNPKTGEVKPEDMNEQPDKQWNRMRNEILHNLNTNNYKLISTFPEIGKIQGGIVFSHPNATFDIQEPQPFHWGSTQDWLNRYEKASRVGPMSSLIILGLAEIFLEKHREVNPSQQVFSMNVFVDSALLPVEENIQRWIEAS